MALPKWVGALPLAGVALTPSAATAEQIVVDNGYNRYKLPTKAVTEAVGDIKIYETSKVNGAPILVKKITPAQVREQVKASNAAFAVPE